MREWTETADSDPGVALLQLFAWVGDLLGTHSEHLVETQPTHATCGLHRATVLENDDPLRNAQPTDAKGP